MSDKENKPEEVLSNAKTANSDSQNLVNRYLNHKPLSYGKKFYLGEFIAERFIQVIALLSIAFIIAIFYYVFQESIYAFKQPVKSATVQASGANIDTNSSARTENSNDLKPQSYGSSSGNESNLKPESYSADNSGDLKPEGYSPDGGGSKTKDLKPESYSADESNKPEDLKPESYSSDSKQSSDLKPETYGASESQSTSNVKTEKNNDAMQNGTKSSGVSSSVTENIPGEKTVIVSKLIFPNDYIDNKPHYIWQPVSDEPKYSFIPLFVGALKVTLISLIIGAPLAILAAIFTVAFSPKWLREIIKPAIEILAGFPSVVIGFFCLITLASAVQYIFGTTYRLNSFVGGLGMALAVIPIIYTIAEDALSAVPKFMKEASLALGASRWQTAYRVTLPAAVPGVFAAIILGFGRAFGETMIALMATGNAALVSADIFESVRTMAATIGAEMAEVEFRSVHYGVLFLIGAVLFVITFSLNAVAEFYVRKRLMKKFQGQ